jgi:hypothetical protein
MKSFLYPVLSLMALLGPTLQAQETAMPEVPPIAGVPAAARQAAASIDPEKIGAHVRFLASDLLEGPRYTRRPTGGRIHRHPVRACRRPARG